MNVVGVGAFDQQVLAQPRQVFWDHHSSHHVVEEGHLAAAAAAV